ncbi:hypothetical protein H5P28_18910 [Ruficoccus amylovorans]|uniref:Uncharacterized protein n=1 Tax=Ruficoccus amylovorans TaxID=1804625 RepID=A0A842HIK2_9BACT|nr:hypothetical protein [Ruficoccus amylovorans]MBC2596343.1 hypothetical protein [Ruficoccus amylovorans]
MQLPRFALIVILALLPVALQAAKKNAPAEPVTTLSDEEVVQRLATTDILAWERAMDLKKQGLSLIDSGKRLQEREVGAFRDAASVARDKEDGKRMAAEGQAKVAEAEAELNALRLKAEEASPSQTPANAAAATHKLDLAPQTFGDDVLVPVIEKQLFTLWGMGYKRILLIGAWASTTDATTPLPQLRTKLAEEMRRKDGNRYSIVPTDASDYLYLVIDGVPTVNYPNKFDTANAQRTALVYAELVPSPDRKETWISLRAVDANSMELIDSRLLLCKNDAALDEMLGLSPDEKADAVTTRPQEPVAVVINDEADFVARVDASNATYQFGIRYLGDASGFRARQAAILLKTILPPAGIKMSDADFFARALPTDEASAQEEVRYDALWQLEPREPGLPLRQTYTLEAISLRGDEERALNVGSLEVASASAD